MAEDHRLAPVPDPREDILVGIGPAQCLDQEDQHVDLVDGATGYTVQRTIEARPSARRRPGVSTYTA